MIPVKCNIHPWMRAYIGVVSHPFFAVTGDDGTFTMKGLPPGTYTIEVCAREVRQAGAAGHRRRQGEQDGRLHDQGVSEFAPVFGVRAFMTLLLVVAGGLVTSNDAGGAIPDWPLSWGKLVPPLEGGIVYAYAHRVLARGGDGAHLHPGMEDAGSWLPFGLMVAQALLGGVTVLLVAAEVDWSLAHACLAQLCFGVAGWRRPMVAPADQRLGGP